MFEKKLIFIIITILAMLSNSTLSFASPLSSSNINLKTGEGVESSDNNLDVAALDLPITVQFDSEIQAGDFFHLIYLSKVGSENEIIPISKQTNGNKLIIQPLDNLEPYQEYSLYITPYSLITDGKDLITSKIITFTTLSDLNSNSFMGTVLNNMSSPVTGGTNTSVINGGLLDVQFDNISKSEVSLKLPIDNNTKVYAGGTFTGIINSNGDVQLWGDSQVNQDPNSIYLKGNKQIAGGISSITVLNQNNQLYAWGMNSSGSLGIRGSSQGIQLISPASPVLGMTANVSAVDSKYNNRLAIKNGATENVLFAWGDNSKGQLGIGTSGVNMITAPVGVKGKNGEGSFTNVASAMAGRLHSIALKTDGTVWSWGDNAYNQLGDGTTSMKTTPSEVKASSTENLNNITAISAGDYFNLALKSDGTVLSWGLNDKGQLGDGTTINSSYPVQVKGLNGDGILQGIIAISAGGNHALALKSDGTVLSWGLNDKGQLGDGTTINQLVPIKVRGIDRSESLSNVISISAGTAHNVALLNDKVVTWGDNTMKQLGVNTLSDFSSLPIDINSTVPSAPIDVKATAGDSEARVEFTAPSQNGGSEISNYEITAMPGNIVASGTNSPIIINGLNNGTDYTFTVVAINTVGKSKPSEVSNTVRPLDNEPPTAPSDLIYYSIDDTNINLSWTPSIDNAGVVNYKIYNGDTLIGSTADTNYIVSNLSKPSVYNFKVKAVDTANNISEASNIITVDLNDITPPSTPNNLNYEYVKSNGVKLNWAPSTDASGIRNYVILEQVTNKEYVTTETNYVINDLESSTAYKFTVTATDTSGNESQRSSLLNVTTDGFINKQLEVNSEGLTTNEGVYNARTYKNGKTFIKVSGYQGDVSQLEEGVDYFQEGQDYWFSSAVMSNYFPIQVTEEKVLMTESSAVQNQGLMASAANYDSQEKKSYTIDDYNRMYADFYNYQISHPELDLSEILNFIKNTIDSLSLHPEQIDTNNLYVTNLSASATSGYETPDELNPLENALENENPDKGFETVILALYSISKSRELFNDSELTNGNGDAFRHAFWGAFMVLVQGYNWAERYGTAHEVGDPNNLADEMAMDLYNNKAGRLIALQYANQHPEMIMDSSEFILHKVSAYSDILCEQILKALDEGQLKRIDTTPVYSTSDDIISVNVVSPMLDQTVASNMSTAVVDSVDPIELSSKHIRTNSTGKKADTSVAPSNLTNIQTYLNNLNFKNGLGQVDYIGNGKIGFKSLIINDMFPNNSKTEIISVPLTMQEYNTGWYATKENILNAISSYFISKQDQKIYSRQVAARSYGTIYNVNGNEQFNTFGGRNSKYPQDINTFINKLGPQWEIAYITKTDEQRLYELQQGLDMLAFIPVVGLLAEGSNAIISYTNGNTMDAMIRAGFGVAGPVASKVKSLKITEPLKASLFKAANTTALGQAFIKASTAVDNLKTAISNTTSTYFNSLITKVYSRLNGRLEVEFAGVGKMSFDDAIIVENANQLAQTRYNNYLLSRWSESADGIIETAEDAFTKQQYTKVGRIKVLKSNINYTSNGYNYKTDNYGRVINVEGQLTLKEASRNEYAQTVAGRVDRIKGTDPDDGGHLIASMFNGSGELDNLVAMNAKLNRSGGNWYKVEQRWKEALQANKKVHVEIEPLYSGASLRPDLLKVSYSIDDGDIVDIIMLNKAGG
jgi:alpha-tubulin suppressor-like RCC1 family protein/chitodextrinase